MTAQKKETGEQKLLRLIEEQGGDTGAVAPAGPESAGTAQATPEVAAVASSVKGLGLPALSMPPAVEAILRLVRGGVAPGTKFGLKEINRILQVVLFLACIAFVANVVNGLRLNRQKITISAKNTAASSSTITIPTPEPLSQFTTPLQTRNIFQPYEKKAETATTVAPAEKKIDTMTADLKLVGISSLDKSGQSFAMIEDSKSGVTHFLSVGETINDVKVEDIKPDEVILTYQGEHLSMKM